jgi:hypothetical protein
VSAQVIRFCDYRRVRAPAKPHGPADIVLLPVNRIDKMETPPARSAQSLRGTLIAKGREPHR